MALFDTLTGFLFKKTTSVDRQVLLKSMVIRRTLIWKLSCLRATQTKHKVLREILCLYFYLLLVDWSWWGTLRSRIDLKCSQIDLWVLTLNTMSICSKKWKNTTIQKTCLAHYFFLIVTKNVTDQKFIVIHLYSLPAFVFLFSLTEKRVSEVTKPTALHSSIYLPLLFDESMVLPTSHNTPVPLRRLTPSPIAIDGKRVEKPEKSRGRCGNKPNYKSVQTTSAADIMYSTHRPYCSLFSLTAKSVWWEIWHYSRAACWVAWNRLQVSTRATRGIFFPFFGTSLAISAFF